MVNYNELTSLICKKAPDFGFLDAKVAHIKISEETQTKFSEWVNNKFNGDMHYLEKNINLRFNPSLLHTQTLSIICIKAPYLNKSITYHKTRLKNNNLAYISSYSLGRDYHKVLRQQLNKYAEWIQMQIKIFDLDMDYRVFTDSAPILEVELAQNAGLGWRGKNTLLLNKHEGSMFFLGEIFTNLPLIPNEPTSNHCGSCTKCLDVCPTNAFMTPYVLDATKCISYLTIENKESIPIQYRKAIGNRIYGCDDCQLFCPWNKFNQMTTLKDFQTRNNLDKLSLIEAFKLSEGEWKKLMEGSAIYRIGYIAWLRNVAVALGNAPTTNEIIQTLTAKKNYPSLIVREHVEWALKQHS